MTIDWGTGHYESTAERLAPAASAVVDAASPQPGERLLDVGCGTGNAALVAAARGASVVGVDPAARLLDVARSRAAATGVPAEFLRGEAAALPVPDARFDAVVSVFGVIFAPDPGAAMKELMRVLAPGGRVVISAWLAGAIGRMNQVAAEAVADALGRPSPGPRFGWHDPEQVAALAPGADLEVSVTEHALAFTAESPEAYVDAELHDHPMALSARQVLDQHGSTDAVRKRLVAVLEEANEDTSAFRTTSRYVVLTLRPR